MGERTLHTLLEGGAFFEGPRWHEGRWWVSDFYRHTVLAVDADGRAEEVLEVEGSRPGSGGCRTARCSWSRCATTGSCGGRRTAR